MRYAFLFVLLVAAVLVGCSAEVDDASQGSPSTGAVDQQPPAEQSAPLENETSVDDVDAAMSGIALDDW